MVFVKMHWFHDHSHFFVIILRASHHVLIWTSVKFKLLDKSSLFETERYLSVWKWRDCLKEVMFSYMYIHIEFCWKVKMDRLKKKWCSYTIVHSQWILSEAHLKLSFQLVQLLGTVSLPSQRKQSCQRKSVQQITLACIWIPVKIMAQRRTSPWLAIYSWLSRAAAHRLWSWGNFI